jgi:hypothetical protein
LGKIKEKHASLLKKKLDKSKNIEAIKSFGERKINKKLKK